MWPEILDRVIPYIPTAYIRKHMNSVFLCTITEYRFSILNFNTRRFCNLIGSHNLSSALQFYINANCRCSFSFYPVTALLKTGLVFLPSAFLMNRVIALFPHEARKSPVSQLKGCFTQPWVCAICIADDSMEQMHLLLNRVVIWNVGNCL